MPLAAARGGERQEGKGMSLTRAGLSPPREAAKGSRGCAGMRGYKISPFTHQNKVNTSFLYPNPPFFRLYFYFRGFFFIFLRIHSRFLSIAFTFLSFSPLSVPLRAFACLGVQKAPPY